MKNTSKQNLHVLAKTPFYYFLQPAICFILFYLLYTLYTPEKPFVYFFWVLQILNLAMFLYTFFIPGNMVVYDEDAHTLTLYCVKRLPTSKAVISLNEVINASGIDRNTKIHYLIFIVITTSDKNAGLYVETRDHGTLKIVNCPKPKEVANKINQLLYQRKESLK